MRDELVSPLMHVSGGKSRIALHWTYLENAINNLDIARQSGREFKLVDEWFTNPAVVAIMTKKQSEDKAAFSAILDCRTSAMRHHGERKSGAVISSILFSALMLEAFINNLARVKLSGFYRENLDMLDLPAKWVLITKEAFGSGIRPEADIIGRIARIQKQRNALVHARPAEWDCALKNVHGDPVAKYRIGVQKAEIAINTCIDALEEVRRLDSSFEADGYKRFGEWRHSVRERLPIAALEFCKYLEFMK